MLACIQKTLNIYVNVQEIFVHRQVMEFVLKIFTYNIEPSYLGSHDAIIMTCKRQILHCIEFQYYHLTAHHHGACNNE